MITESLRKEILERDNHRCRWCGRTNVGVDVHHIRYRRGDADDEPWNLISMCRVHHRFVHGERGPMGQTIEKAVAQAILWELVDTPGVTGLALWRRLKKEQENGRESESRGRGTTPVVP